MAFSPPPPEDLPPGTRVPSERGKAAAEEILIPEGVYRAVYLHHDTVAMRMYRGAPKVFVHFRIVDPGSAFEAVVYRSYRAQALNGRLGRNGAFQLGRRSNLYVTLCQLTRSKLPRKGLSLEEILGGRILEITVRTVTTDMKGRPLPDALHYSVVNDVIGAETVGQQ